MPRARTIRRLPKKTKKSKSQSKSFVPEIVQSFIARRLVDAMAAACFIFGAFTLIALLSYSADDPSMNSAGLPDGQSGFDNWMGSTGAWFADLLIQPLGIGGLVIGAGFLAWSVRISLRHILTPFALRALALTVASIGFSLASAQIPSDWTPHVYLGGAVGTLSWNQFAGVLSALPDVAVMMYAPLLFVVSSAVFLYAAAVSIDELRVVANVARMVVTNIVVAALNGFIAFRNWLHRYNNPDYEPEPLFTFSLKLPQMPERPKMVEKAKPAKAASSSAQSAAVPAKASVPAPVEPAPAAVPEVSASTSLPVVNKPKETKSSKSKDANQSSFKLESGDWELPPIDMLEAVPEYQQQEQLSEEALLRNAQLLQNVLADFKIEGEIKEIFPGPVVTLYELEPAPGTKSSRVISLSDDIARSMAAISVRCAVVPGRNVIGIEIPNKTRQIVYMQELLLTRLFQKNKQHLPLILGKDIGGQPILADLAKMPHLLVAGTTGSGKSVAVNTMILSLLYRLPPEKCRMIMIDPKMLELSVYDDIPHLLSPVVTEPGKAVVALKWTVQEMENRYRAMSKLGVRNIEGYNARMREATEKGEELTEQVHTGFDETGAPVHETRPMDTSEIPYIVVIVDEFADLMLVAGKDVENAIQRLAQMARAAGIHLIMATQRPSVDVITGVVKANFPTRISFQVTSKIDSRTILGEGGAEQLLGMGDMLYMAPGGRITRVHGPFVSDDDVEKVVNFLKQQGAPAYLDSITDDEGGFGDSEVMNAMFGDGGGDSSGGSSVDELYDQAVAIVAREGKASTSFIQRHLQIGYNRAARIIEEMEKQGVVSPANATGKRTVFVQDFSDV